MLLAGGVVLISVLVCLSATHRTRLIILALLFIPQIYVPGMPITLSALWTLITCVLGLTAVGRPKAGSALVYGMAAFVAATAFSLFWALPDGMSEGFSSVFRGLLFLLLLREVIVTAREDSSLIDLMVKSAAPAVALQSVLVIAFRVSPALEEAFLRSKLALVTIGPGVDRLYSDMWNNVLQISKSGGLYVNGNMASLLGGIAALVLAVTARRSKSGWLYVVAGLAMAGSISTGSKTAIVVVLVLMVAAVWLPHMLQSWALVLSVPIFMLIPLLISTALEALGRIAPGFYNASDSSFGARETLWGRAWELFLQSPLEGLGFGGWTLHVNSRYPPHNYVIAAWSNSGLVAAALVVTVVVTAVAIGLTIAAKQAAVRDRRTAVLCVLAIVWVLVHGMADNTSVYGEQRSMYFFTFAVAYLYVMNRHVSETEETKEQRISTPFKAPNR